MGIIKKVVGKVFDEVKKPVKSIAYFAADVLTEGDEKARLEVRSNRVRDGANGRIIVTVDNFIGKEKRAAVRNYEGVVLFFVRQMPSKTAFRLYDADMNHIGGMSAGTSSKGNVRFEGRKIGEVQFKVTLKGVFYYANWSKWKIKTNLLTTKREFFAGDEIIAEVKKNLYGDDQFFIYLNDLSDLRDVLLAIFAIDAMLERGSENIDESSEWGSSQSDKKTRKERKAERKENEGNRKKHKQTKIDWKKVIGDDRYDY